MTTTTTQRTNLVDNNNDPTTTTPLLTKETELLLLTNIAYPFFNQYHRLKLLEPFYAWQDFILQCYDQCVAPMGYRDQVNKSIACNRIAQLLLLSTKSPPTKEQYTWIYMYAPYLGLVPKKITQCKRYGYQEWAVFTSSSQPQPIMKKVTFERTKKTKRQREPEPESEEEEEEDGAKLGTQLAAADARVNRSILIYNMSISYCEELLKKVEHHKNVTIPAKEKQMRLFKKQRSELMDKVNKKLDRQ